MRRGISRDLSFKVQKVLLSIFASSVLLYEQVLYSGHTPKKGYLHGIHIPCQGGDLVYAFWWSGHLDKYFTSQVLAS